MHLEVSFRNLHPRDEIKRRADALFDKLDRFLDPAAQAQLVVAVEHNQAIIEIVVTSHSVTHKVTEEDEDLRTALDRAFHTLESQLRRAKEKRTNHKGAPEEAEDLASAADEA